MDKNTSANNQNHSSSKDSITLSQAAEERILEIQSKPENKNKHLRITILGGGCSGFQYNFKLDDKADKDDFKLIKNKHTLVVIDQTSLGFLHNCLIDYVNEMGGSYFKIDNPNAAASCGCGSSFSI